MAYFTNDDIFSLNELCFDNNYNLTSLQEAKFHFFPKFKDEPGMKPYLKDLKAAEKFLNANGEVTETNAHKFGVVAIRILDIIANIEAVVGLPVCILLWPIPAYIIDRLVSWGYRAARETIAKAEGEKILRKYNSLISKTTDKEFKDKLIEQRDKISKSLSKLYDDND